MSAEAKSTGLRSRGFEISPAAARSACPAVTINRAKQRKHTAFKSERSELTRRALAAAAFPEQTNNQALCALASDHSTRQCPREFLSAKSVISDALNRMIRVKVDAHGILGARPIPGDACFT